MAISVDTASNVLLTLKTLNAGQGAAAQAGAATAGSSSGTTTGASTILAGGGLGNSDVLNGALQGLGRAATIADLAVAAGGGVASLLGQLKQAASAAADPSVDAATRRGLNTDYKALLGQIQTTIQSAGFDGVNLLDGSSTAQAKFATGTDGSTASLSGQNLSLGGAVVTVGATSSIGTASAAGQALSDISQSLSNIESALGGLTAQADQISAHGGLLAQTSGLAAGGAASDPDADGARLQALQIQQQLAGGDQSIANQAPQMVLALFR